MSPGDVPVPEAAERPDIWASKASGEREGNYSPPIVNTWLLTV
jgi:hypothetical protein